MDLTEMPALEHPELLAAPVLESLRHWKHGDHALVVQIDPEYADTEAMTAHYGTRLEHGANCVVVSGRRDGQERIAACMVRADTRADINGVVKRALDVRKCSFLSRDRAVSETGMEYGGITPVGLPQSWRLLVDTRVAALEKAIIGSGIRGSKIYLSGRLLAELPGAEIIDLSGTTTG